MERRYQVFISSTFTDLVDERREVMQAILEMDCLPAGMELFPAGNEDQWTLIKGVIEQSDYYLVIIGGRYGSTTEEGISFTEMEYDYAVSIGIPVMGFVHAAPDEIPVGKTDKNDAAAQKLAAFQAKVQTRMTKDWKNAEDLGSKVTRGLIHLIKNNPRPGWVRGDQAMTPETRTEIAELRAQIAQLEKREIEEQVHTANQINTTFAHGEDQIELEVSHVNRMFGTEEEETGTIILTWDEIFKTIGPVMLDEAPESTMRLALNGRLFKEIQEDDRWGQRWQGSFARISDEAWGWVMVQLRALGLIASGTKKRGVSDKAVYWKLTPAGDGYLVGLTAIPATKSN